MSSRWLLIVGGVLMLLLGVARGAGGLVLIVQGATADPNIQATGSAVSMVGAFLLLLGLTLVAAAVGVFRRSRPFWVLGMVATVLFVIDGAVNGYILYGRPGDVGTMVNGIAAALILACLLVGRRALRGGTTRQP